MFTVWIIIVQSLNIKEWKLLELRLYKPDSLLAFYREKMSMFKTPQNELTIHEMYTK